MKRYNRAKYTETVIKQEMLSSMTSNAMLHNDTTSYFQRLGMQSFLGKASIFVFNFMLNWY